MEIKFRITKTTLKKNKVEELTVTDFKAYEVTLSRHCDSSVQIDKKVKGTEQKVQKQRDVDN